MTKQLIGVQSHKQINIIPNKDDDFEDIYKRAVIQSGVSISYNRGSGENNIGVMNVGPTLISVTYWRFAEVIPVGF